ncbi:type VII secretion protein EccB [Mycobacterium sp. pV006]|uniref:type VII secretion protein EccB n=1 Tax=Mycobacterium sp. pV006 TaxID=3238983 RepID=UPI00351B8CBA
MAGQITRLQVSGHRFLARRMRHALVRADTRMLDDPLRAQGLSLSGGIVAAALVVAVCVAMSVLRPAPAVDGAPIIVVPETASLYVSVDAILHPVPNLASARLVTGSTDDPVKVSRQAVDRAERGPALGIPSAPTHLGRPLPPAEAHWTVCDDQRGVTTVLVGALSDREFATRGGALVAVRGDATATYLLHGGQRSRVDLRLPAVVRALKLDGVTPREVSPTLLAALPEAPAITPPSIPAAGTPGPPALGDLTVGTVVAVPGADGPDHYVVLADGVQRIGSVTADLIRYSGAHTDHRIPALTPDAVGRTPVRTTLPVHTHPDEAGVAQTRALCVRWQTDGPPAVLHGDALPSSTPPIPLVQADDDGPAVDAVAVPAGRSVWVRSVGVTGIGSGSGPQFLVDDSGVVFGVADDDAATRLGLTDAAVPAPWPILSALPRGPELSRSAASVPRDGPA